MRFSIIIPVFRVEKYLQGCIESVLRQSFDSYELILVDDGSDDNCPIICDSYAEKNPCVKVIHKSNGGLVSARKAGARIATGEYIINIDGDDWIDAHYLQTIDDAIVKSESADIIIWGTTIWRDNRSSITRIWNKPFGLYAGPMKKEIEHRFLYDPDKLAVNSGSVSINLVTKAVKRDLYTKHQNIIDDCVTKGEDALLSLLLLMHANSIYCLEYYGYNYRYVTSSISNSICSGDFDSLSFLVLSMLDIIKNDKDYYNQICAYAMWRLVSLLSSLAKNVDNYSSFKAEAMTIDQHIIEISTSARISKKRLKDYIKIMLLKKQRWFELYLILKHLI